MLSLISKTAANGETYWYAMERTYEAGEDGARRLVRRQHPLGVKGKSKRRAALAAMQLLEYSRESPPAARMTVAEWCAEYLASARASVRPHTHTMYTHWLGAFAKAFPRARISELTSREGERWRAELSARVRPNTVNAYLRAARACLQSAVRHGVIPDNPLARVRPVRVAARTFPAFVTMRQYQTMILPRVADPRQRVTYCLAIYAGLRRDECAHLRWTAIDFDRREIRIESGDGFETKSGKGRVVPLYRALEAELTTVPRRSPYVLGRGPRPPDASLYSKRWRSLVAAVRADHPDVPSIPFHGLRHSYATHLAASGLNLRALMALMGHSSITTTMLYAHVQPAVAVEAARGMEP